MSQDIHQKVIGPQQSFQRTSNELSDLLENVLPKDISPEFAIGNQRS